MARRWGEGWKYVGGNPYESHPPRWRAGSMEPLFVVEKCSPNELNDGNTRSRKVGDCVVLGRVKMVCSIPVCGGDAGFYLRKSR